jgi:hypothetical protein
VEVHNRGLTPLPGGQVQVVLLLTDATAGLPALPTNYASHIVSADINPSWLGSSWFFADPATPYRVLPGDLSARTPQVVYYDVDFSLLSLPPGDDHVCAAAFITTPTDPLTASATSSLDTLTMSDKHVAHRNLHLVVSNSTPAPPPSRFKFVHPPQTFVIDFHNAQIEESTVDLVFQRPHFGGHFSLVLPKLDLVGKLEQSLQGIKVVQQSDGSQVFVTDPATESAAIKGVRLPPLGRITANIAVQPPPEAVPGNRFRFNVLQTSGGRIVGGSTYVLAVTRKRERT